MIIWYYVPSTKKRRLLYVKRSLTHHVGEEEPRMRQLEVLEQRVELQAVEVAPGTVQVLAGLGALHRVAVVEELQAEDDVPRAFFRYGVNKTYNNILPDTQSLAVSPAASVRPYPRWTDWSCPGGGAAAGGAAGSAVRPSSWPTPASSVNVPPRVRVGGRWRWRSHRDPHP